MIEILQQISAVSVLVFVVGSMLNMGLNLSLKSLAAPLKSPRLVISALILNFAAAPLLAVLLARLIPLNPSHAVGLLLLGGAAGSPFLPKLAEMARGSLAYGVALMILLMVGTILFLPLALPFMVPGLSADAWTIAKPLVILMLLPLAAGVVFGAYRGRATELICRMAGKLSNLAFLVLMVLMVGLNIPALINTLGSFAIGAYLLFLLGLGLIGYALAGKDHDNRGVFILAGAQRNVSAALVVATSSSNDSTIVVMLLIASVLGLVVLLTAARWLAKKRGGVFAPPRDGKTI